MNEETLFQEALSRAPEERSAFLERACEGLGFGGHHPDLRLHLGSGDTNPISDFASGVPSSGT